MTTQGSAQCISSMALSSVVRHRISLEPYGNISEISLAPERDVESGVSLSAAMKHLINFALQGSTYKTCLHQRVVCFGVSLSVAMQYRTALHCKGVASRSTLMGENAYLGVSFSWLQDSPG